MSINGRLDAVVIGGGFYGTAIAIYLARQRGMHRVLVVERERSLLARASYNNQARVHNGYHYPRSFTTAYRSRVNFPKFVNDWKLAVKTDFAKLYAIARRNSKVTAKQFHRFCEQVGARAETADKAARALFDQRLIEDVFLVEECVFDATRLAEWAERELSESRVSVRLGTRAIGISKTSEGCSIITLQSDTGSEEAIISKYVFNCTYSGLNQLLGDFTGTQTKLKHEITEMALMQVPPVLDGFGITVMDGPFFSLMPFPPRGLKTLSHVRYTPHCSWKDDRNTDPYRKLSTYECRTRADRMVRDAGRYVPAIFESKYIESLFEVKTTLEKNEGDDGRPILFERHSNIPGCYSILGGKIDNIYDVLERLEDERFETYSMSQG